MTKQNLLIIGSTGWIGTYITHEILAAKANFGRIVIFTSASTLERKASLFEEFRNLGVEIIVGDVSVEEDIKNALEGITTVISAVGRAIISTQISWLPHLLSSPTVRRFYPSEYGTDIAYSPSSATEKPHQQKLAVRKAITDLLATTNGQNTEGANAEGYLEYTYLVTGPYTGGFLSRGSGKMQAGGFDVKGKRACVLGDGTGRVSLTTEKDVGKLLVSSLLHPAKSRNRALCVNSFTTTPLEIVTEFEKQTGGQTWEVTYTSFERIKELEKEAWEKGNGTGFTLRRIWGEGGTLYDVRDNGVVGLEEGLDSLEDAVRTATGEQVGKGEL